MHTIRGKVRRGKDRGKKLGYPTANIALHKKIPQGIYISQTVIDRVIYPSVSFVGNAKTFGEDEVQLEIHIFSFDENIYNKWISVRLLKKIRTNQEFDSKESLREQIKKDVEIAEEYFKDSSLRSP